MKYEPAKELGRAHDVLNRMKKAHDKGRGIRISAEELHWLSVTSIGSMWEDEDPRKENNETKSRI